VNCIICERIALRLGMCRLCAKSYDRDNARNDGTIRATIEWAAKRARFFAKRSVSARLGIGGGK
jgi:hypothetical protein